MGRRPKIDRDVLEQWNVRAIMPEPMNYGQTRKNRR